MVILGAKREKEKRERDGDREIDKRKKEKRETQNKSTNESIPTAYHSRRPRAAPSLPITLSESSAKLTPDFLYLKTADNTFLSPTKR